MSYEAGSKECRHLIEAKESLLSAMDALSNINSTDLIQVQIKEIYNKLENMHDNRKKIESATNRFYNTILINSSQIDFLSPLLFYLILNLIKHRVVHVLP